MSVRDAIVETAASSLIGLYVCGSLVAGDFDAEVSDVDLIAALATDPVDPLATALESMHDRLARRHPAWADRIEVVYVSAGALETHRQGISRMAAIAPGAPFHVFSGGSDWVLTWYPARQDAIALIGPEIHHVVPEITQADFLNALRGHLSGFGDRMKDDATRGASAHAILTICRGLYTLRRGIRPSKIEAARWATGEFPAWAGLIESAVAWRREQWTNPGTDPSSVRETRRFVHEMTARIA